MAQVETFANVGSPGVAVDTSEASEYYSDTDTDMTSIASSALDYQYENGRRYHAYNQDKYVMPNDDEEKDRLDLVHHVFSILLGGESHNAPLQDPRTILDLGTGTGIWAVDVAEKYPSARVIGNDLSAIQPSWVPNNLEFFVDDFELDWTYKKDYFDFIHARTIAGCVKDWGGLFKKIYDHLKPGGYFEIQESAIWAWSDDGSLKDDSPYMQYLDYLRQASESAGRKLNIAAELKQWIINAGFEDVKESIYVLPCGTWPKEPTLKDLGRYQYANAHEAVEAYGLRLFTHVLGWSEDKAKVHLAAVKNQLRSRYVHSYTKVYAVYGRKPF